MGLLNRDPKKRLGSDKDVEDVKSAAFFSSQDHWDWDRVYRKEMDPPFKPKVKDINNPVNFDDEFLREPVVDSVVVGSALDQTADFQGFTFTGGQSGV